MTSHPLRDFERAVIYWLLLPMVRDFGIRLLSLLSGNLVYFLNMVFSDRINMKFPFSDASIFWMQTFW